MNQKTVEIAGGFETQARGRNGWFKPTRVDVRRHQDVAGTETVALSVASRAQYHDMPPVFLELNLGAMAALHAAIGEVLGPVPEEAGVVAHDFFGVLGAAFPEASPADLDDVRSLAGEFYRVRKGEGRAKHETVTAAFYEACRAIGAIGNLADGQLYIRPVDENALPTGPRIYIPEVQG